MIDERESERADLRDRLERLRERLDFAQRETQRNIQLLKRAYEREAEQIARAEAAEAEVERMRETLEAANDAVAEAAIARAEAAEAKVARVEALHVEDGEGWCADDGFSWPCRTHRALAGPEATEVCECCGESDEAGGWVYGSDGKPWCGECYRSGEATEGGAQ